jgi:hypothetical protein
MGVAMQDRRIEPRISCPEVVDLQWKDSEGRIGKTVANLEDISRSGASFQLTHPVPIGTTLCLAYKNSELTGKVKYCVSLEDGYFVGIEFEPGSE